MKGEQVRTTIMLALFAPLAASAAVPIRWTVETSRVQPLAIDAYHGEEIALEAAFNSYGKPLEIEGEPMLFWQTNGMQNV